MASLFLTMPAWMQVLRLERKFCLPAGEQNFLVGTKKYKEVFFVPETPLSLLF